MSIQSMKSSRAAYASRPFLAASGLLLAAAPAFAHHPMGGMTPETFGQGFLSGLGHPVIGLDHLAFLIIAAMLTFTLKGAARFTVPMAFIAATVAGTLLHLGAANIPLAEALVAATVVVGAVLVLARSSLQALVMAAVFAVSGIFHGYAYGEAVVGAETTPILAYLLGFAAIQYGLIVGGALAFDKVAARSERVRTMTQRVGGFAALAVGGIFLALGIA
ncbi:MAG: HupE/UreJ family protein [Thiohalocapsa sp.]|jgi:urease accessory protein|nr:HupE/UreJ family protein [Thiohalocapsa sp.]MCF7992188.1 HupE/UreJ family protein [Thiohalocapsa sp.]